MYQIRFTQPAQKQFKKLDPRYLSAVKKALKKLSLDPTIGKPLIGKLKGKWKLRFSRYRIIYKIQQKRLIVFVLDVKHRKDAYR